jgi:hypothetical protein
MEDINSSMQIQNTSLAVDSKKESEADTLIKATKEERSSVPYMTASSCNPIGVLVPTKLAYETIQALNKFTDNGIDTAEFVRAKLKYTSRLDVCDSFSAEQVDALALAITQVENKKGFILGDMAGIGKGRVVAGMLRYAKQNGKIPVFITYKGSLFSDIFRDFIDIGGFYSSPDQIKFKVDVKGNITKHDLPNAFIFNDDKDSQIKIEWEKKEYLFAKPYQTEVTVGLCRKKVMPKNMDLVVLTYSQIQGNVQNPKNTNAIAKVDFLKSISDNAIFVLDESHIGGGNGGQTNIVKNLEEILASSSGVMFASATYSKTPKAMRLYIPKTDIASSRINPETIVSAVQENGEAVQEYIASLLVKSGQMIRRERSFDKCRIDYKYIKDDVEKYYNLYDKVMELYNEVERFADSELYKKAVENAIKRYVDIHKVTLVSKNDPKPKKTPIAPYNAWIEKNKNKFTVYFKPQGGVKNRFNWIENLLFSIKAQFVTDEVLKLLSKNTTLNERNEIVPNMVEYNVKGEISYVQTNYKPIIALRNTGEASLNSLGWKTGDDIARKDNDYARTLIKITRDLVISKLKFVPVVETSQRKEIVEEEATIIAEDFDDLGLRHREIVAKMSTVSTSVDNKDPLPLSPIDYMIEKIQSVKRQSWDSDYEYTTNEKYVVEEMTGRNIALVKNKDDDDYKLINRKEASKYTKVDNFNSGKADVVIINTSASTGISLHSSAKFKDKRPRVMVIQQVELDVNTEVQKRGRINRTGQVNLPAYTYMVSCVPSEIRKLLMFRRKLRSLDANTTGNIKQSARSSEILDSKGNIIEDMSNKYGYAVLLAYKNSIVPVEIDGKTYYTSDPQNRTNLYSVNLATIVESDFWGDADKSDDERFETYLRKIEQIPCTDQEIFYNEMNELYVREKDRLVNSGEWDLDTSIEDLKSFTRNKKTVYIGSNENEFTKSVYIEDKFVSPRGVPYTKDELLERMNTLSMPYGSDYGKFHSALLEDYDAYSDSVLVAIKEKEGEADLTDLTDEEEIQEAIDDHNTRVELRLRNKKMELDEIVKYLSFFVPNRVVYIPVETDLLKDGHIDPISNGLINVTKKIGKFVGYKILKKSENTFLPMNIELEFASPSKMKPHLKVTLTQQYRGILEWIMATENRVILPPSDADIKLAEKLYKEGKILEGEYNRRIIGTINTFEYTEIESWLMRKSGERENMRILTGELFKAFELSKDIFETDPNYIRKKRLIKYTTASGGVETGVRLFTNRTILLTKTDSPIFADINTDAYKDMIENSQGNKVWFKSKKDFIVKKGRNYSISFCKGYGKLSGGRTSKLIKELISEYVKQDIIDAISQVSGINPIETTEYKIEMSLDSGLRDDVYNLKFTTFQGTKSELSAILDFMYQRFNLVEEIRAVGQEGEFIIREDETMDYEGEISSGEGGEYQYYPMFKFDPNNVPPNYIANSYKEIPENPNGIITLKYPLPIVDSSYYFLLPVNITQTQAVRNILSVIKDDKERLDYIQAVKGLNNDYLEIARLTERTIKISPKYAIGNVTPKYAGKVIAENISNPAPQEAESLVQSEDIDVIDKIDLDWNTAEEFVIKLKSL